METAASWAQAAEVFRELLRTDRYPVGSTIRGITEIRRATGVSHPTAQRALDYLADQGELAVRPGAMTVVLPRPAYPLGSLNEIDRILADLDEAGQRLHRAIRRYQRTRRQELAQPDEHPETKDESA